MSTCGRVSFDRINCDPGCSENRQEAENRLAELLRLQKEAEEQINEARTKSNAAEDEKAKLLTEEAARKQRFGFLQSTFAKEKAALQERLDASERELSSQQAVAASLQRVGF